MVKLHITVLFFVVFYFALAGWVTSFRETARAVQAELNLEASRQENEAILRMYGTVNPDFTCKRKIK